MIRAILHSGEVDGCLFGSWNWIPSMELVIFVFVTSSVMPVDLTQFSPLYGLFCLGLGRRAAITGKAR
jgi:hypothetical protein